jgi:putative oxidoreductase
MKRLSTDVTALLLRLAAGAIFLPHGYSKVFGAGGAAAFAADLPSYGIPTLLGYLAAYAEFFGAILLIAGLVTRLDAFLLACTMGVAVAVVQLPDALHDPDSHGFGPVMRAIELPLAMFAITTAIVLVGPGRFSLDSLLRVEERVAGWRRRPVAAV